MPTVRHPIAHQAISLTNLLYFTDHVTLALAQHVSSSSNEPVTADAKPYVSAAQTSHPQPSQPKLSRAIKYVESLSGAESIRASWSATKVNVGRARLRSALGVIVERRSTMFLVVQVLKSFARLWERMGRGRCGWGGLSVRMLVIGRAFSPFSAICVRS